MPGGREKKSATIVFVTKVHGDHGNATILVNIKKSLIYGRLAITAAARKYFAIGVKLLTDSLIKLATLFILVKTMRHNYAHKTLDD